MRIWKIAVAVGVVAAAVSSANAAGPTIYGAANDITGAATLYSISPATGVATSIGAIGFSYVQGLALSPGGVLYATGYDAQFNFDLITINTATGAGTSVALLSGISEVDDMAFRPSDGTLFAFEGSGCGCLYTINTTTGAATLVDGSGGQGGFPSNALAFSNGSILYSAANIDGPSDADLEYVDQIQGTTNNLVQLNYDAAFGSNPYPAAMKFDPQTGILWTVVVNTIACDGCVYPSYLGTINLATGHVSFVGATATGMDGVAIPGSIPAAPATPVIYGSAYSGTNGPATLYRISPSTGIAGAIGEGIGFNRVGALSLAPNGVLYGVGQISVDDEGSQWVLLTINPLTGVGTQVGQLGIPASDAVTDIAVRPSDGTLFAFVLADGAGEIYTINTSTGLATRVGPAGEGNDGDALAFSVTSPFTLYTANNTEVETINQATGLATSIFALNYIPELGSSEFEYRANGMKFDSSGRLWASVVNGGGESPQTNYLATIALNSPEEGAVSVAPVGVSVTGLDAIAIPLALAVTNASLPGGTVGTAYTLQLTSFGGVLPLAWSASSLPAGLALNPVTGVISGTPTTAAVSPNVSLTVTDAAGEMTTKSYSLTIGAAAGALAITTAGLPEGSISLAYSVTLTATGGTPPYAWSAVGLPGGLALNSITGSISGTPATGGGFSVAVTVTDSTRTAVAARFPLTVLAISSPALPANGTVGSPYSAQLTAIGGAPPYTWSATNLPAGVALNTSSGLITGAPTTNGSFVVMVTVTDTTGTFATASYAVTIAPAAPPLLITTGSLPSGTISVSYSASVSASGGSGSYTFSIASGSLPPGLSMGSGGNIGGVPVTLGTFSFTVRVADTANHSTTAGFSVQIKPATLTITTGALGNVAAGSISVGFNATGGIPPYTWALAGGSVPPGLSMSGGGALAGSTTATGAFSFTVSVTDSIGTVVSKSFSLTVAAAPLAISGSAGNGQEGSPYSAAFSASGGQPPYTWSSSGLPGFLGFSNGVISGTAPLGSAGAYPVTVMVTDSAGKTASASFTLTISPAALALTGNLPNGTVGMSYSSTLGATGGGPPYSFSASGLPQGLSLSGAAVSGTPTTPGNFSVKVTVTDSKGSAATQTFAVTITVAPITITTPSGSGTSLPGGTAGSPFTGSLTGSGGIPPYTWTFSGLPPGLTGSSNGTISGMPTTPGTYSVIATVTDSTGATSSQTLTMVVGLPPAPPVNITGGTAQPASQSSLQVKVGAPYPVDITVILTMTFTPNSGPDDPTVEFANGSRTAQTTISAGSTVSLSSIGIQTGTVAGTITITAQLLASSQNVTPTPAPVETIVISPSAPVLTGVTATVSGATITVTINGYATDREVQQATFQFTPVAGSTLQTSTFTVSVAQLFTAWYQNPASAAFGSQFSLTLPFTVAGNSADIASVTVTFVSNLGSSQAVTANVP